MKNRNLMGLAALLLLIAAVFFGSVMCPPASERGGQGGAEAAPGAVAPAPGLTEERDPAAAARTESAEAQEPRVDEILVRVTDMDGRPLAHAEIFVNWADRPGTGVAARAQSGADGTWLFQRLPQARFRLHAVATGYFPSAKQEVAAIPSLTRAEIVLPLERGGLINGLVFGMDGAERPFGWLRFRDLDQGTVILARSDERGSFTSGPLRRGAWEAVWLEHEQAEPDPRLHWSALIEPGTVVELLVTVDELRPGKEARAGRAVGIVPR